MRAIVNRATQIGLLDKCTSAYWARIRICIFREHNLIPAGIAEKILLRIPATDRCHFGQRGFHSAEQRVQFSLAQRRHLPFRVDPCIEKNILQDAVSQAGNPLLRSKERFGGKIRFSTGHQAVEISGIEPIAERGILRLLLQGRHLHRGMYDGGDDPPLCTVPRTVPRRKWQKLYFRGVRHADARILSHTQALEKRLSFAARQ